MKYTDWIIPELKNLEARRAFILSAPERINDLTERSTRLKSSAAEKIGGGASSENQTDEALVNNLTEREKLEQNLRKAQEDVRWIEHGLQQLTVQEQTILERFYVRHTSDCVQRLMDELHFEKSQLYRIKNNALIKLARILLGTVEL